MCVNIPIYTTLPVFHHPPKDTIAWHIFCGLIYEYYLHFSEPYINLIKLCSELWYSPPLSLRRTRICAYLCAWVLIVDTFNSVETLIWPKLEKCWMPSYAGAVFCLTIFRSTGKRIPLLIPSFVDWWELTQSELFCPY